MKIMFFMESYYCGGVDTFVINLINNWPDDSEKLILICNKNHSGIELIQNKIKRPCEIIKHRIVTFQQFFNKTQKVTMIERIVRFVLKMLSPILRYVFLAYNIFALRKVLLKNNPDQLMIINGGYPGGDSCRAASISWGLFSKKPLSIHNFHGVVVKPGWHIGLQEYLVDLLVSRFTKAFVTVSHAAAELMSLRNFIYKKCPISHIYSGLEILNNRQESNSVDPKLEIGIPLASRLCLMLGNYNYNKNYNKGHHFLFQAFKKVVNQIPTAHLLICGHGSAKDINKIRRLASRLNVEGNIHLSSFREDILSLLKSSDVLLISAQAFESFGYAAIEAMAHRVPVITTRVGGLPEIVVDGQGGYCIEKDDVDSYADYIIKLLRDDNLAKEQGQEGFQRYRRFFTATRMAEEYTRLIHNNG